MAQPIYFLPGLSLNAQEPLTREHLRARGLADVFSDVNLDSGIYKCSTSDGPGSTSGLLVCAQTNQGGVPHVTKYKPSQQDWHAVGDDKKLWIGLDKNNPVTPADIERNTTFSGYRAELGDGQRWLVPVIRRPDGTTNLPCDMIWAADGSIAEPIKSSYRRYWEDSAIISDWFFEVGFDHESFNKGKSLGLAVQAIGLNYRYDRNLHQLLRLVDTANFLTILAFAIDTPKVDAVEAASEKKSESPRVADASNTTPGQVEESEATALAAANYI